MAGSWPTGGQREERGDGSSHWDPSTAVTIYIFKNLVPG